MAKYTFSAKVAKGLKQKLDREIVNAVESSPEMVKEIRRVCQVANRRAQNVEKSGVYSPAVAALHEKGYTGYTKFSSAGSWQEKKEAYAAAVAFLNQPTSSATGAKEYLKQFSERQHVDMETGAILLRAYDDMRNSSPELQATLERYPSAQQDILSDFNNVRREMYESKEEYERALQREIENKASVLSDETIDILTGGLRMG